MSNYYSNLHSQKSFTSIIMIKHANTVINNNGLYSILPYQVVTLCVCMYVCRYEAGGLEPS